MKKYYVLAIMLVILIAAGFVVAGLYINRVSESNMTKLIETRVIQLAGERAAVRALDPELLCAAVDLYSEKMNDVVARINGTMTKTYVKRGDFVRKGQLLCELVNEDLPLQLAQVDSKISSAEAEKIKWENSSQRHRMLLAGGAVSQSAADEADAGLKAAVSALEVLKLERAQWLIKAGRQSVAAPADGYVLLLYKQPGAYVENGASLALIGDFSVLYFKQTLSDKQFAGLLPLDGSHSLQFTRGIDITEKTYAAGYRSNSGETVFDIAVIAVDPGPAVASAYRNVTWQVDNRTGLLEAGIYHGVNIVNRLPRRVLAIPRTALLSDRENAVFTVDEAQRLTLRTIQTGVRDATHVEVVGGLSTGEAVVTSGKEGLTEGAKVQISLAP